jgi:hypothetical protein
MLRIAIGSLLGAMLVCTAAHGQVPVTVVNPAAHPVPTRIMNTPSVTVANPVQVTGSVQVTNMPAVTISGTPTVTVANQPGGGTIFREILGVNAVNMGSSAGTPGEAVPAGMRRIIDTISAVLNCPLGETAVPSIILDSFIYLPMQLAMTDFQGHDIFTMLMNTNIRMAPGAQMIPQVTSKSPNNCLLTVYLLGAEVPNTP